MTENSHTIEDRDPSTGGGARGEDATNLQQRLLLLPICLATISLSALGYYHLCRDSTVIESPLQRLYATIYLTFGFAPSFMFFLLLLIWSSIWFFTGRVERPWSRLFRLFATAVMLGVFLNVGDAAADVDLPLKPYQGELGAFLAQRLVAAFGGPVSFVVALVATLGALLLATDFLFSDTFERLWVRSRAARTAGPEVGVEHEVTDHLKGLAAVAPGEGDEFAAAPSEAEPERPPQAEREPEAAPRVAGPEIARVDDEAIDAEVHDFRSEGEDDEAEVEPAEDEPLPTTTHRSRRRSWFERRYEELQRRGEEVAAPEEDEWVPSPPEPQEIENTEWAGGEGEEAPVEGSVAEEAGQVEEADEVGEVEEAGEVERQVEEILDEAVADAVVVFDEAAPEAAPEAETEPETEPEAEAEPEAADEPVFSIPRPPEGSEAPTRQQPLFPSAIDEALIEEAKEVVLQARRVSATLLRRRLRIGYDEACEVLTALSARGIVELDGDASHGRVVD